jgi:DNA-binding NarL/FixJ family response regulator
MSVTIRVVIGEDSYLARQGILGVLEDEDDIEIVAACGDVDSLRSAIAEVRPDVVLTDIRMPPTTTDEGIRLAAELRRTHPDVGVVILSQYAEPLYAARLLEEGSERRGYLLKDRVRSRSDLARALREVAAGRAALDSHIVDLLMAVRRRLPDSGFARLTAREEQILALVAEGWSDGAIAERVMITRRSVERHVNAIFSKLGLGDPEHTSRRVKAALLYLAVTSANTPAFHMAATW